MIFSSVVLLSDEDVVMPLLRIIDDLFYIARSFEEKTNATAAHGQKPPHAPPEHPSGRPAPKIAALEDEVELGTQEFSPTRSNL